MKKAVIIAGSVMLAVVLVASGIVVYSLLNQYQDVVADRTGSNSVNVMLTRPPEWRKIVDTPIITEDQMPILDGSTATIPITAELYRQFFDYTDDQVQANHVVWHSTTHQAYLNLIDKTPREGNVPTSLILVSRPSDEEKQYAAERGVELDMKPVSLDGFVFITHKDNPVDSLTPEQIRGIYTGKITNWNQVGGPDLAIRAYQREANSGSQTAMEHLVMKGEPMMDPINAKVAMDMGGLVDAVAEYNNGPASIGYTYYYYINNLYRNDNIKVIRIDGIAPTNDNLISGTYPYTSGAVAVIRADEPAGSPARTLRDWLVSPAGQDVVAMAGYCKAVN